MRSSRIVAIYFLVQAIAGLIWWIAISRSLQMAEMFFPVAHARNDMRIFALADWTLFIGGSALVAWLVIRKSRFAFPMAWVTVGAVAYATLCTFGLLMNGGRLLSIGLMLGSLLGTLFFASMIKPFHNQTEKS